MTVDLFMTLLAVLSIISSLITQAIKKILSECGRKYTSNIIILCVAMFVGLCGTFVAYILYGIPFTLQNVICAVLMSLACWLSAMFGYDKIQQTMEQMKIKRM